MRRRDFRICRAFEESLPALSGLDGNKPGDFAAELLDLSLHAFECDACAEELRAYQRTVELLRALPRHEAPAGFLSWVSHEA